jgi:hypothetical protein
MDSLRLFSLVAVGSVIALGSYAMLRRKTKSPADLERERRTWLDGIGRITDGTVIDVNELQSSDGHHAAVLRVFAGRDLLAPVDQPAFVPARPAHFGEIRPA